MIKYIFSVLVVVFSCNSIFSSDGQVSLVSRITNAAKDLVTSDKFVGFTCGSLVALCAMHKEREIEAPMLHEEINYLNNCLTTSTAEINRLKDLLRIRNLEIDRLNGLVTAQTQENNCPSTPAQELDSLHKVVANINEINSVNQKQQKQLDQQKTAYEKLQFKVGLLLAHYPSASIWFDKNDLPNIEVINMHELLNSNPGPETTSTPANEIVNFLYRRAYEKINSAHAAPAAAHASDGDDDTSQP